jgi:hypothetical protein
MMAKRLKKGDDVSWSTSQGKVSGKVVKKQSAPTKIKDHKGRRVCCESAIHRQE